MKKQSNEKKSLKKQLISGAVYVALAGVVVAVAINTTVGIISDRVTVPDIDEMEYNMDIALPSVPEFDSLILPMPQDFAQSNPPQSEEPVSDIADGVNAEMIQEVPINDTVNIPQETDLGFDKFINPCGGYVSKEFSVSTPVYSPTMGDYRTHKGIDIVGESGIPVYVANGGVVTEIYDDDLFGTTVCMQNRDGLTIKYCGLMPELYAGVEVGKTLKTGDCLGGIGNTALCESAEASHLHLEIINADGEYLNPEEFISF